MPQPTKIFWTNPERTAVAREMARLQLAAISKGTKVSGHALLMAAQKKALPKKRMRDTYPAQVAGLNAEVVQFIKALSNGQAGKQMPTVQKKTPAIIVGQLAGVTKEELALLNNDVEMAVDKVVRARVKNELKAMLEKLANQQ